jgi:hypothetical protein
MSIVTSIHEGFHNAPKLYGSKIREKGEVTDFKSGLKEAGKVLSVYLLRRVILKPSQGFFYGYYDGITGLVREPIKGAKTEVRVSIIMM